VDDELKRALEEYRAARVPAQERQDAARAALGARISAGDPGLDVPPEVLGTGGSAAGGSAIVKLLGLALVVGGVAAGVVLTRPAEDDGGHDIAPVAVKAPEADEAVRAPEPTLPSTEPAPAQPPPSGTPTPSAAPRRSVQPTTSGTPPSDRKPASPLREEMELMSRGQRALQSGDAAAALRAFDEHRTRFPSGALAAEREVKRLVALCSLGRGAEARAEAERFARRHAGSPLADHARKICKEAQ